MYKRLPRFEGEWETKPLMHIADIRSGGTPSTTDSKFWNGGIPWCTPTDITALGDKKYLAETERTISEAGLQDSSAELIPANSIVMTSRATIGECAINTITMTTNQGFKNLIPSEIDTEFLYYLMINQKEQLLQLCGGSTFLEVGKKQLKNFKITISSNINEQRAIATALSDVDALIDSLDRLIAKKRDIKQATMQQLLTGRKRLPGFEGEWELKRLKDVLTYERPEKYIVQSDDYKESGNIPVLTANQSFVLGYTVETFGIYRDPPVIIFDDFTTDSKWAEVPFKVKSSAIKLLKTRNNKVNLRYIFERMQLINFPLGNHKRFYISEYQNIKILIPSYEEQTAIANILSDMDAEIEALEHRREKTKQIKQGMMQELLTGRTRLIDPNTLEAEEEA